VPYLLNIIYLLLLVVLTPWIVYSSFRTGKYRRGIVHKLFGTAFLRQNSSPCVWFHGVSVGEIHLLRTLVAGFRKRHPDWDCVISTTTDTGYDEACKRFSDLTVFYWPLDFTWAVHRALARVNPTLVILAEGELWPNFLWAAKKRNIPVAIINGRLSPRSARTYDRLGFLSRRLLTGIGLVTAQTEEYAAAFRALGAPPERTHVTGSIKYDGVVTDRNNTRTREMARLFGTRKDDLVWVAGSTQAPEEEIVLTIYRKLQVDWPNLRLILVPRHKERFDEVAGLLKQSDQPFVRRSELSSDRSHDERLILVDTIGELSAVWGLADIAFVGGSLGNRGGQNMLEPAAYGAAVVFGPHVWNFKEIARRLLEADAASQIADPQDLAREMQRLLKAACERSRLGANAGRLVQSQQGATDRTLNLIDSLIGQCSIAGKAA
jgi:3-deoxy-D-manno-octulosonic-acid transferase